MQHNKHSQEDLEYLSELGFEAVPVSETEIEGLRRSVKARAGFPFNKVMIIGLSLIIGALAGILLFQFWNTPSTSISENKPKNQTSLNVKGETVSAENSGKKQIILDTVNVVVNSKAQQTYKHESFVKQTEPIALQTIVTDSVYVLNSRLPEVELSPITSQPNVQLRFIPNSPVVYLHDLKITDYHSLYFKKQQMVALDEELHKNLDASRETKDKNEDAFLNIGRKRYYLHQAISDAMYYFSRKEYASSRQLLYRIKGFTKEDINCDFYLGMGYYYQQDFKKALKYIQLVLENDNNTFLQEAEFYKALCLQGLGDTDAAMQLFKKIKAENGFYADKAGLYMK